MTRGRKPAATFGSREQRINEMATRASNKGIYTVESLREGLIYFIEEDTVIIASSCGFMKCDLNVAELIANELSEVIEDVKQHRRDHRKLMDARHIGKMLEV